MSHFIQLIKTIFILFEKLCYYSDMSRFAFNECVLQFTRWKHKNGAKKIIIKSLNASKIPKTYYICNDFCVFSYNYLTI